MKLSIHVDDKKTPTNFFVEKIFTNVIEGMVAALKDIDDPKKIVIELRQE